MKGDWFHTRGVFVNLATIRYAGWAGEGRDHAITAHFLDGTSTVYRGAVADDLAAALMDLSFEPEPRFGIPAGDLADGGGSKATPPF